MNPQGSQPNPSPQQGQGQGAAARRAEERREREDSAARRGDRDRAVAAQGNDDPEDLGDFGDGDWDTADGSEYDLDGDDNAVLQPPGPPPEPLDHGPPPAETPAMAVSSQGDELAAFEEPVAPANDNDPLDVQGLGGEPAEDGDDTPLTRTLTNDELLDLSRRAMNESDTISDRDWLSFTYQQGERGTLPRDSYLGPARFDAELAYRRGLVTPDAYSAAFDKWEADRQAQAQQEWLAQQPEPRFTAERSWMLGQIDEPTYSAAFDAWAGQHQAQAEEAHHQEQERRRLEAGGLTGNDLLDSGAGGLEDEGLMLKTKPARFAAEAQYLAGRMGRDDYLIAFTAWGASQQGGAPAAESGGLVLPEDGPAEAPADDSHLWDQDTEFDTSGYQVTPEDVRPKGSDLPGFGVQARVQPVREPVGLLDVDTHKAAAAGAWDWMLARDFDAKLLDQARTRGLDHPTHGNTTLERLGAERLPDPGFNSTPFTTAQMQRQIAVSAGNEDAPDRWKLASGGEIGQRAAGVAVPPYGYYRAWPHLNTGEKWLYGAATGAATLGMVSGAARGAGAAGRGLGAAWAKTQRGQTAALSKTNRMLADRGLPPMTQKEYNAMLQVAAKTPAGGSGTATLAAPEAPVRVSPAGFDPWARPTVIWTPPKPQPWALPGPATVPTTTPVSTPGPGQTPAPTRTPAPEWEDAPTPGQSPAPTRSPAPVPGTTPTPAEAPQPQPVRTPATAAPWEPAAVPEAFPTPLTRTTPDVTPATPQSPAPQRRTAYAAQAAPFPSPGPAQAAAVGKSQQPDPEPVPEPIPEPVRKPQPKPDPEPLAGRLALRTKPQPAKPPTRYPRRTPSPTAGPHPQHEPVLPKAPGRFPRTTRHAEKVRVSYDSISDSFSTELLDYDDPVVTGWDLSPPQQTARQVGGLSLTPKRRGVTAEHDAFMDRAAEVDPAIQQELRRKAAKSGGGVVSGDYSLSFDHDLDAETTSALYERPPAVKAARRDALAKAVLAGPQDLKGKRRKARKEKLKEFGGELPGVVLTRPPPLKEAPMRM